VTPPLVRLDFDSATLSPGSLAADDLLSLNGVVITGSAVPGGLSQEAFAFAFANHAVLPNQSGFTATASFTSSAIPEPSMLMLLDADLCRWLGAGAPDSAGGAERRVATDSAVSACGRGEGSGTPVPR